MNKLKKSLVMLGLVFVKPYRVPTYDLPSDYIERMGWCQKRSFQRDENNPIGTVSAVCAVGAIHFWASRDILHRARYVFPLREAIRIHAETTSVGEWNDAHGQTMLEVLRVMRLAEHQVLGTPAPQGWIPPVPLPEQT